MENSVDPGLITLNGDPLKVVLAEAFKVKMDQIVGGPSWLDSDCFVVIAKVPEGAAKDQVPAMFQSLLAERFKLAAHKETHSRPGYVLAVDKNGLRFKESDSSSAGAHAGSVTFGGAPGVFSIRGSMSMTALARFLSNRLSAPVADLTGLKETYDIDVSWTPDPAFERVRPVTESSRPRPANADSGLQGKGDIFTALHDVLGLRLERRKVEVETVVIDHIERIPTGN